MAPSFFGKLFPSPRQRTASTVHGRSLELGSARADAHSAKAWR
jgi:hypothetical protein